MFRARLWNNLLVAVLCAIGFCLSSRGVVAADQPMLVGVAKVDITPEFPVRMYGYESRTAESRGVAGPLMAKALVLGDDRGEGPAVLLAVDCGAVPESIREEVYQRLAQKTKLAPERFVLCNSHSHSAPDLKGMPALQGAEQERLVRYAEQLIEDLEAVVSQALADRVPARLALARGSVDFATNRRVLKEGKWVGFGAIPDAPANHDLPVLKVTAEDGRILALLFNYACHNTTLRGDFPQIHGDWAGCAQQQIEADQPGAVALVSIGCGADSDPCPHGSVALCEQHGHAVAEEVKRLMSGRWKPVNAPLTARQCDLAIAPLAEFDEQDIRNMTTQSFMTRGLLARLEAGQELPKEKLYRMVTWTFGDDLAMVFLSDEVVVDYALRLRRELDANRLWLTAYAHDVSSYIVSKRLIQEGGYEVQNSLSHLLTLGQPERMQPAMEDRIVEQVKSMLPEGFHAH